MRLTVKERILLHLLEVPRQEEAVEVSPEVSREGVAGAVGIHVRHLTQYIRPLVEETLVQERKAHVRGIRQRRKVYSLTDGGRMEAIRLRKRVEAEPIIVQDDSGAQLLRVRGSLERLLGRLSDAVPLNAHDDIGWPPGGAQEPVQVDFSQEIPSVERFYGRETELEDVRKALTEVPLVVVSGIAGVGKTALGAKIRDEVRGKRALFWRRVQTWDSAADLLRSLADFLRALGRPELLRQLQERGATELGRTEELLQTDLTGLETLLVFDDLQNASQDCLTLFQVLLRVLSRTHPNTWALMLTREVPRLYSRREVLVDHSVKEFILGGLSKEASLELLAASEVPHQNAPSLAELASGHPLFLKLLGGSHRSEPVGAGLNDLEAYISEEVVPDLDEDARACLEAASFFEIPVSSEAVLLATREGKETLFRLRREGLLDFVDGEIVSVHPRIRAYFREGLPPERRETLLAKIVPWMLEDARRRTTDEDFEGTLALLENVVTIETDPHRLRAGLGHLGLVRQFVGDFEGAIEAYRRAFDLTPNPEVKAWLHRRTAETLFPTEDVDEMEAELLEAERLGLEGSSREGAALLLDQAGVAVLRATPELMAGPLEEASSRISTLPRDPYLIGKLAHSKGLFHLVSASQFDPQAALTQLKAAVEAYQELPDSKSDAKEARDEMAALRREEERFWRMNALPWMLALMGDAAVSLGRVGEGLGYIDEAIIRDEKSGFFGSGVRAPLLKARVLTHLGRLDEAEELLGQIFPRAKQFDPRYRLLDYHRLLSDLYYWKGRLPDVRKALESWYDAVEPLLGSDPVNKWRIVELLALLANVCTQLDDLDAAERYTEYALAFATKYPSKDSSALVSFAQASLLAARGVIEAAEYRFREAAAFSPEWRLAAPTKGWILLEYGKFLAANGKKQEARDVLGEAQKAVPWRHEPLEAAIKEVLVSLD